MALYNFTLLLFELRIFFITNWMNGRLSDWLVFQDTKIRQNIYLQRVVTSLLCGSKTTQPFNHTVALQCTVHIGYPSLLTGLISQQFTTDNLLTQKYSRQQLSRKVIQSTKQQWRNQGGSLSQDELTRPRPLSCKTGIKPPLFAKLA